MTSREKHSPEHDFDVHGHLAVYGVMGLSMIPLWAGSRFPFVCLTVASFVLGLWLVVHSIKRKRSRKVLLMNLLALILSTPGMVLLLFIDSVFT